MYLSHKAGQLLETILIVRPQSLGMTGVFLCNIARCALEYRSLAGWQNGYAPDCKSVYLGSTPGPASIFSLQHYQITLIPTLKTEILSGISLHLRAPLLNQTITVFFSQIDYSIRKRNGTMHAANLLARVAKLVDARDLKI